MARDMSKTEVLVLEVGPEAERLTLQTGSAMLVQGPKGDTGLSAWAYAVSQGYTGTEADFAALQASLPQKADAAAASAAAAETAQGLAEAAQDAAASSATAAETHRNNAAASATNAASSASSASGSASAASSAKSGAESARDAAVTAKNAAESARAAADTAKSAAQTAQSAAESASATAQSAAASASTAKAGAENARDTAEGFAAGAESVLEGVVTARNAAQAAQAAAETARTAAVAAQGLAETAQAAAETAGTDAQSAKTAAETARSAAQTAQGLAETAKTAAQGAQAAAEAAKNAAQMAAGNAEGSAEEAEAWATGTINGGTVSSVHPAYQNNAKWYKDQAAAIVGGDYPTKAEAQSYATTAKAEAITTAAADATAKASAALGSANIYTDQQIAAIPPVDISGKVDKVAGKGLSTEDYTTAEKTKLSGIATSANNYVHPTTAGNKHIPTGGASGQILRYSASGTAVWGTDSDTITTINGKSGAIAKEDITALGIPAQDTVYTHPASHPPSIITQDTSNRFVTDAEKSTWSGKANASHTHVKADINDFPTSMPPTVHKASHAIGGNDTLLDADIAISADVATELGLNPANNPQIKDAFRSISKIGDIKTTTRTNLGSKWALCNGTTIDVAAYPELYAKLTALGVASNTQIDATNPYVISRVVYANGFYVALVGTTHSTVDIYYATDPSGIWTLKTIQKTADEVDYVFVNNLQYINGYWIICAMQYDEGTSMFGGYGFFYTTTPTGTWTWKYVGQRWDTFTGFRKIAYNGTYYVATLLPGGSATEVKSIAYTTNLTGAWTTVQPSTYINITDITVFNNQFVLCGYNSNNYLTIEYTANPTNASNWTPLVLDSSKTTNNGFMATDGTTIVVASHKIFYSSSLPSGWNSQNINYDTTEGLYRFEYLNGQYMLLTYSSTLQTAVLYVINSPSSAATRIPLNLNQQMSGICYGTKFVLGGNLVGTIRPMIVIMDKALPMIANYGCYTYIKLL